ncbi:MAG: ROK family protein [Actinomycetota bacterium]|nr:ROK family protein [Actinomycetota bacterium]
MNLTEASFDVVSIGVDIGGTKTLGLALTGSGEILVQETRPTPQNSDQIVECVATLFHSLANQLRTYRVSALGIGVAGLVDKNGQLHRAPNLADADGLKLQRSIEPLIDVPVYVDNDANCAARAELIRGAARNVEQALLVTLGTGIGGAVISDGKVARGAEGMAGEPGHMLVDPNGPICACGMQGCWESYASGTGLVNLATQAVSAGRLSAIVEDVGGEVEKITGEHVTAAARKGDEEAIRVIDAYSWWVAVGLANCAALIDPEIIILGGGLIEEWELWGPRVRTAFDQLLIGASQRATVRIEPAAAGELAGAVGAALLAASEAVG